MNIPKELRATIDRFASSHLAAGYEFTDVHHYVNREGDTVFYRVRWDHPDPKRKKEVRPVHKNANEYIFREPVLETGLPLYHEYEVARSEVNEVFVVEGESCADALMQLGLLAVTSGASSSTDKCQWDILAGRVIKIWPDNDAAGERYAAKVAKKCLALGCSVHLIDHKALHLPKSGDVRDWLQQHHTATREDIEALPLILPVDNSASSVDVEWPNPEAIDIELRPVPTMSPQLIPEPVRGYCENLAHRMQCPLDFVGTAILVVLSTVIGAGCQIRPKRRDDWAVTPNVWGGVIGAPGMMKTPAVKGPIGFLKRLEEQSIKEHAEAMKAYERNHEIYTAKKSAYVAAIKSATKEGLKADLSEADQEKNRTKEKTAQEKLAALKMPIKPVQRRYASNDATVEKVGEILSGNPRGLLLQRDELAGQLANLEKPGREGERAFLLEGWNGDQSFTFDRIGRGTIYCPINCLSVFGTIQPKKLEQYLCGIVTNLGEDGMIQRFQLFVYPDQSKKWELVDEFPDLAEKERVFTIVQKLAFMNLTQYGAVLSDNDVDDDEEDDQNNRTTIPYFTFADDAQEFFYEWLTDLETNKLRNADEDDIITEHLAKYRSLMPSLALIIHLVDISASNAYGPVSLQATRMAAALCDYYECHARRIYGLVTDMSAIVAKELAKKISGGHLPSPFTIRDVYRKGWSLLKDKEWIESACAELCDAGWLYRKTAAPSQNHKTKTEYHINPAVWSPK